MNIVADENIPLLEAFFGSLGTLVTRPGRQICRADLEQADVLLVRSVTQVNAALLEGTPVRFVGTCTIGTDHLDLQWLAAAGIRVASAPGCNARGVVEYVLSCLLTLAERTGQPWLQRSVGIIGVGAVGGLLASTLEAMGMRVLRYDPLRAEQSEQGFVPLEQLLIEADVLSCHVPLTLGGDHPTWHLLDQQRLQGLRTGCWLINSSRGAVVDNLALGAILEARSDLQVVLDVWEGEPQVDPALARQCALATPHIAGYSLDGKLRGTAMIHAALCAELGVQSDLQLSSLAPVEGQAQMDLAQGAQPEWLLARALRWVYDVRDDDARMREMLTRTQSVQERALGFDQLRKQYPLRRENALLKLDCQAGLAPRTRQLLAAAGFSLG
ncbi:MAG: 4-phosphoerythronate dehydrogenase PdxB [Pseudomonas sp.]